MTSARARCACAIAPLAPLSHLLRVMLQGKGFSVNVPLKDGIRDEPFLELFTAVVGASVKRFSPDAIVMQCGAGSLAGDRIGSFNLTHVGHCAPPTALPTHTVGPSSRSAHAALLGTLERRRGGRVRLRPGATDAAARRRRVRPSASPSHTIAVAAGCPALAEQFSDIALCGRSAQEQSGERGTVLGTGDDGGAGR